MAGSGDKNIFLLDLKDEFFVEMLNIALINGYLLIKKIILLCLILKKAFPIIFDRAHLLKFSSNLLNF